MEIFIHKKNIERISEREFLFHLSTLSLLIISLSEILLRVSIIRYPKNELPFIVSISILIIYFLSFYYKNFKLSSNLLITLLVGVGIMMLYYGEFQPSSAIWLYMLPVLMFFLLERLDALLWILILFSLILSLLLLSESRLISDIGSSYTVLQIVASLSLTTGVTYLYTYINDSLTISLKETKAELEDRNQKIKMIARQGIKDAGSLKNSLQKVAGKNKELEESREAIMDIVNQIDKEKDKVFEQREKLRIILNSIGDGVVVMDIHRRIILLNRSTEEISGYSRKELLGQNYSQILRLMSENKEKTGYINFISEIYDKGVVSTGHDNGYILKRDGEKIPVSFSASPIKNMSGKVIGSVVVFRDTSKEKEIDRMKTEFVSVASHQLRTPLTGIKWYTELLGSEGNENLSNEQRVFIKNIEENADRMIDLVNDLLDVSRIDMGKKFSIEKESVNLIQLLKDVIIQLSQYAKVKDIRIEILDKLPNQVNILADPKKISQVFYNILSNAVKYSPEKSIVKVKVEDKNGSIIFSAEDNGVGIPESEKNKIFTKFFRAKNVSNGSYDGTGLGLYIVKAIVEGHNGKVWFESRDGEGTTFYVELPKQNV